VTEKPKLAAEATKAANNVLLKELPFTDKLSFELAHMFKSRTRPES